MGHWVPPAPISAGDVLERGDAGDSVMRLQQRLRSYGYGIETTGKFDGDTEIVVKAFQRHFRPALIDGRADVSTIATLDALLEACRFPE